MRSVPGRLGEDGRASSSRRLMIGAVSRRRRAPASSGLSEAAAGLPFPAASYDDMARKVPWKGQVPMYGPRDWEEDPVRGSAPHARAPRDRGLRGRIAFASSSTTKSIPASARGSSRVPRARRCPRPPRRQATPPWRGTADASHAGPRRLPPVPAPRAPPGRARPGAPRSRRRARSRAPGNPRRPRSPGRAAASPRSPRAGSPESRVGNPGSSSCNSHGRSSSNLSLQNRARDADASPAAPSEPCHHRASVAASMPAISSQLYPPAPAWSSGSRSGPAVEERAAHVIATSVPTSTGRSRSSSSRSCSRAACARNAKVFVSQFV